MLDFFSTVSVPTCLRLLASPFSSSQGIILAVLTCSFVALDVAAVPPGDAPELEWRLFTPDCDVGAARPLKCGRHGQYVFLGRGRSKEPIAHGPQCQLLGQGVAVPSSLALAGQQAGLWQPCEGGSCFEPDGVVPDGQYTAVIDWNDQHGQTVAAMIQDVAGGMPIKLYDIETTNQDLINAQPEIGDAHILAKVCEVAEDADTNPATAINLSLGRGGAGAVGCGSEPNLACEVKDVIQTLQAEHSMMVLASAGNHGDLLFPASVKGVFSVGSLDLSDFGPTGGGSPELNSPSQANGQFPGYGLFLEEPAGERVWAAPPGSSYATAFATGWLLNYERFYPGTLEALRQGEDVQVVAKRAPDAMARLYYNGVPLEGSDLSAPIQILRTALGKRPHICNALVPAASYVLALEEAAAPSLDLSFVDQAITSVNPAPDSQPCVPCQLHSRRPIRAANGRAANNGATLDFEASAGVATGSSLEAMYLVRNGKWFEFGGRDIDLFLAAMEVGGGGEAVLADFEFDLKAEVRLVYLLRNQDDTLYWDSTPMVLHDDLFDPFLMRDDFESGKVLDHWSSVAN